MSLPDESLLDEQIRALTSDTVPPTVEGRLRSQLADFRSQLSDRESAGTIRGRMRAWIAPWRLGVTCAAVILLIAVAGVFLRPQTSFAEVTKAVLDRPWVHMRVTRAGRCVGESEIWFSPARSVWASMDTEMLKYEDHRLQISETYDLNEGVVTRIPIVWNFPGRGFETMVVSLAATLQQERPSKKPLKGIEFLAAQKNLTMLDQRVARVTEADHAWLEYHLTVAEPTTEQTLRMLVRADAVTKLPTLCRVTAQYDGKPATIEMRFDYPETGPADLYALGVPGTAKYIDRVPADDVQRIVETIKAGRERMDNYRAVFVMHLGIPDGRWWTAFPAVLSRKGTKFRTDYPCGQPGDLAATRRPDQGVDLGKWWRERTKSFPYYPQYVVRDATTFTSLLKTSEGTSPAEIASVQRTESGNRLDETYPPDWSMRPEFGCRPPMGLGHPQLEPVLDLHPTDGPPGCILLRVRHTSTKGRVNEKGIGVPDAYRFWLDPKRDYIVMRWDMVMRDAAGQETILESDTTEETARSPQGVWYATKIRRSFPDRSAKDKLPEQIYHLYVDFNVELPDSLFEPPTPGKLR